MKVQIPAGARTPEEFPRQVRWQADGFFVERGLISSGQAAAALAEVVGRIRADPPAAHAGQPHYFSGDDYFIFPERHPSPAAVNPEDRISRVFSCHTAGVCRELACDAQIVARVAEILGLDLDCFQSQFIFKNPGVIGQPWHQDSFYFAFDQQPQVGVWVALTAATVGNGCLWVLPGSHHNGIHEHGPDTRPAANEGYLEIAGQDCAREIPVLMSPGDVLFFHSYLMHKSTDNVASYRRAALVYHYGRPGSKAISEEVATSLESVNRWMPVSRA